MIHQVQSLTYYIPVSFFDILAVLSSIFKTLVGNSILHVGKISDMHHGIPIKLMMTSEI